MINHKIQMRLHAVSLTKDRNIQAPKSKLTFHHHLGFTSRIPQDIAVNEKRTVKSQRFVADSFPACSKTNQKQTVSSKTSDQNAIFTCFELRLYALVLAPSNRNQLRQPEVTN